MPPAAAPMDAPKPPFAARLMKALGLPDDTEEDAALALVTRLVATLAKVTGKDGEPVAALAFEATPDPRRFMPVAAVQALLAERATTLATMSEERAAARVADALRKGHISPAMKGWATALCRSDGAAFDALPRQRAACLRAPHATDTHQRRAACIGRACRPVRNRRRSQAQLGPAAGGR